MSKFDRMIPMGSVPNYQKEILNQYAIRYFKCKLEPVKKGFTGRQWNRSSKSHKGSEEYYDPQGVQLVQASKSASDLVGTVDKQNSFVAGDILGRRIHSTSLLENLTKSIEIQVDMDYLNPQSMDASVQYELIGGSIGIDSSTSIDDFDSYLQSHQGWHPQEKQYAS